MINNTWKYIDVLADYKTRSVFPWLSQYFLCPSTPIDMFEGADHPASILHGVNAASRTRVVDEND